MGRSPVLLLRSLTYGAPRQPIGTCHGPGWARRLSTLSFGSETGDMPWLSWPCGAGGCVWGCMGAMWPWAANGVEMEGHSRMVIQIYMLEFQKFRKQNGFKKSSSAIFVERCYFFASFWCFCTVIILVSGRVYQELTRNKYGSNVSISPICPRLVVPNLVFFPTIEIG